MTKNFSNAEEVETVLQCLFAFWRKSHEGRLKTLSKYDILLLVSFRHLDVSFFMSVNSKWRLEINAYVYFRKLKTKEVIKQKQGAKRNSLGKINKLAEIVPFFYQPKSS